MSKMKKIAKEELQKKLHKNILKCSEEEIRFMFHVLSFDLKEFKQEMGRVQFEVHYTRTYVMRIEAGNGPLCFNNEWIDFGEGSTGVCMGNMDTIAEIIATFMNMFGPNILDDIDYGVYYNKNWSIFDSLEEAQSYLEAMQKTIGEIIESKK